MKAVVRDCDYYSLMYDVPFIDL